MLKKKTREEKKLLHSIGVDFVAGYCTDIFAEIEKIMYG